ncbi:MAG: PepSY domain-containing protein [Vicinamibacterales bacterium]
MNGLTARKVHTWVGVALAVPMTLIAVTGMLLGFRGPDIMRITVPARWVPGYANASQRQVMAFFRDTSGTSWIGTDDGLWTMANRKLLPVEHFGGQRVVAIVGGPAGTPIVGTVNGVWSLVNGTWQVGPRGRLHTLSTQADGSVVAVSGGRTELSATRPMISRDGVTWEMLRPAMMASKMLPPIDDPRVSLTALARDLHTGGTFFGRSGEIWWDNILGGVLAAIGLTGLWIWLKNERRKVQVRSVVKPGRAARPAA